ncbi:MAG: hypothetical protein J1E85_05410 [Ruminococcus sp.]|nr:hypothetical protein [Ruminococcus sp.]
MKTNSRKKLLVSSVAMLLVAMIALGTATFAWFTSSTSVTADGITVRTSKTSRLEISDDTIAYTPSGFTYSGMSAVMVPASSADGKQWFYTEAASADAFTAKNTSSFSQVPTDSSTNKYVYKNQLNIKNAGDQPIQNVQITITNFSGDYLRVALVPVSNKAQGGDATMTAESFRANIYGNTNNTAPANLTYNPVESTTSISSTAITPKTEKVINVTSGAATLAAGAEVHYNLLVWFEGQDAKCYDSTAGQGVTNLQFAVTGTPVSES